MASAYFMTPLYHNYGFATLRIRRYLALRIVVSFARTGARRCSHSGESGNLLRELWKYADDGMDSRFCGNNTTYPGWLI